MRAFLAGLQRHLPDAVYRGRHHRQAREGEADDVEASARGACAGGDDDAEQQDRQREDDVAGGFDGVDVIVYTDGERDGHVFEDLVKRDRAGEQRELHEADRADCGERHLELLDRGQRVILGRLVQADHSQHAVIDDGSLCGECRRAYGSGSVAASAESSHDVTRRLGVDRGQILELRLPTTLLFYRERDSSVVASRDGHVVGEKIARHREREAAPKHHLAHRHQGDGAHHRSETVCQHD